MNGRADTGEGLTTAPSTRAVAVRMLVATQLLFFFFIFWCVALVHDHAVENAGISYYGVHAHTIALAIVGYVAAAVGLWWTSTLFRAASSEPLAWIGLRVVAVVLVLLLLTPYSGGTFLNWAHMTIGVVGALVQLAMSGRLVARARSLSVTLGAIVQLLGGVVAALSLPDWPFEYLLVGEIVFQLGFSWCLLEWARTLDVVERSPQISTAG